jgi:VWFA-related protein
MDLVVLHPSVRDRRGQIPPELSAANFVVFEDGVRQTLRLFRHEDVAVTVGLIIDHSGSMQPRMADVVEAAREFVRDSSAADELFVVNFNESVSLGLPAATPFTSQFAPLQAAIGNAPVTGQTALYDALALGMERLRAGTREKKVLLVVSDGGDNASRRKLAEILTAVHQTDVVIYTIGIFAAGDPDRNPEVLRSLARATGGEAYFPNDTSEVVPICARIAADIRQQYTLGYVSGNSKSSAGFRSVRVTARAADAEKLVVRVRSGYMVAPK